MSIEESNILDKILWAERCIKKHELLYNNILSFNSWNEFPFKVKVYNYYHGIVSFPLCKICKNPVNFHNGKYSTYCSNVCSNSDLDSISSRKDTMINKYGCLSLIGNEDTRKKIKETNLSRYGFETSSKSGEVKKKISKSKKNISSKKKDEINNKRIVTNLIKYGVDNVAKSDDIKLKTIETNLNNYGYEFSIMSPEIINKRRNNYLNKTGKSHHFQFQDIVNEMQVSRKKKMADKFLDKLSTLNLSIIDYSNGRLNIMCDECKNSYNILIYVLYQRLNSNRTICTNCNPLYNKTSSYQSEIIKLMENNNIKYIKNDRKILNGKEIDILIPDKNIGIEINGLYWHNEFYKDKYYHLNKKKSSLDKGIRLVHIWEDDWLYKKDICLSYLSNILGICNNRIYARKCEIREVTDINEIKSFLSTNHLQGFSPSQIKIGLYYNNELVSLMTFGKRNINSDSNFELIRFCNKLNHVVVGSATRLFNFFIKNYDFDSIISFSDESSFDGLVYEKMGFKFEHLSEPNYYWVVDGVRNHRFNFNKKRLVKLGFDANKTEVEIMHERGYYRIWGCGQKKWIYEKM